jgi:hypothetical protein
MTINAVSLFPYQGHGAPKLRRPSAQDVFALRRIINHAVLNAYNSKLDSLLAMASNLPSRHGRLHCSQPGLTTHRISILLGTQHLLSRARLGMCGSETSGPLRLPRGWRPHPFPGHSVSSNYRFLKLCNIPRANLGEFPHILAFDLLWCPRDDLGVLHLP